MKTTSVLAVLATAALTHASPMPEENKVGGGYASGGQGGYGGERDIVVAEGGGYGGSVKYEEGSKSSEQYEKFESSPGYGGGIGSYGGGGYSSRGDRDVFIGGGGGGYGERSGWGSGSGYGERSGWESGSGYGGRSGWGSGGGDGEVVVIKDGGYYQPQPCAECDGPYYPPPSPCVDCDYPGGFIPGYNPPYNPYNPSYYPPSPFPFPQPNPTPDQPRTCTSESKHNSCCTGNEQENKGLLSGLLASQCSLVSALDSPCSAKTACCDTTQDGLINVNLACIII